MKKTLVSALTTALVIGAASTTFAAANPFEDVPADHWAYDAIAQLAADGVIEGYGDGTYRGDQEITRYEMAQMIARAMAKGGGDKALIDKLAAEFADELNNLGVRVAALEKKVDNVKWGGRIRYRYMHMNHEHGNQNVKRTENPDGTVTTSYPRDDRENVNQILLRFEPQMKINEHWTGKARLDYGAYNNYDTAANDTSVTVDRIYVQGDYNNFKILLGKLPYKTQADYGLVMDRYFSGGSITFGSDVKVALNIGRMNNSDNKLGTEYAWKANNRGNETRWGTGTSNYGSIEVYGDRAKKFTWGVGWHYFRFNNLDAEYGGRYDSKNYSILALGLGYKFTPDLELTGAWSRALSMGASEATKNDVDWGDLKSSAKNSYAVQLNYKGAKANKVNSWGMYVAWRQIGMLSSTGWQTYALNGPQYTGSRGFEVGASWTPMKNLVGKVEWFTGKDLAGFENHQDHKVNTFFTEWSFIF